MPNLLSLPDELLLGIQGYLITRKDRFALGATCKTLQAKVGGTFLYEQDVAEERDFDEARLRLERFPQEHPGLVWNGKEDMRNWAEVLAAKIAEYGSGDEKNAEVCNFLENCVGRWGPKMLYLTDRKLEMFLTRVFKEVQPLPKFPDSQRRGRHTLIYTAIHRCTDMKVFGEVVDAYLKKYPKAINGLKSGFLHRAPEMHWKEDYPVYLACRLHRIDVLDILYKKGVSFNLIKRYLTWDRDTSIHRDWDDVDEPLPFDPNHDLLHPDLWRLLRQYAYWKRVEDRGPLEDVLVWLVEHKLGFSDKPNSLNPNDLVEAARLDQRPLLAALIKHFEAELSPDEYRDTLTAALHAAIPNISVILRGLTGPLNRDERSRIIERHHELLDILLRAGARLRQDPDRTEDAALLTLAAEWTPPDAIWLLQRQMAEGVTDHRDVRAALHAAMKQSSNTLHGDYRGEQAREFLEMIYPAKAHLACDPSELATAKGRDKAPEKLLDSLIEHVDGDPKCYAGECYTGTQITTKMAGTQQQQTTITTTNTTTRILLNFMCGHYRLWKVSLKGAAYLQSIYTKKGPAVPEGIVLMDQQSCYACRWPETLKRFYLLPSWGHDDDVTPDNGAAAATGSNTRNGKNVITNNNNHKKQEKGTSQAKAGRALRAHMASSLIALFIQHPLLHPRQLAMLSCLWDRACFELGAFGVDDFGRLADDVYEVIVTLADVAEERMKKKKKKEEENGGGGADYEVAAFLNAGQDMDAASLVAKIEQEMDQDVLKKAPAPPRAGADADGVESMIYRGQMLEKVAVPSAKVPESQRQEEGAKKEAPRRGIRARLFSNLKM